MMNKTIYLDNAATTKTDDEVLIKIKDAMSIDYGNPSSLHSLGLTAHKKINESTEKIKKLFGENKKVIFTSGGTESNNLVIFGLKKIPNENQKNIITTKIEHPSILESLKELEKEGFNVIYLDVDDDGIIDIEEFKNAVTKDTFLITIMHANNETGSIQPIDELYKITKETNQNILFHTDASQTFKKLQIPNVDLITISSHKFHGPKGIGALILNSNIKINPIFFGGHQQNNIRSGTHNYPGIIGISKAIELDTKYKFICELSDYLILRLKEIENISINGPIGTDKRLGNIININLKNIEGEVMLHHLEQNNIFISTGSACSASKQEPSHVLKAIRLPDKEQRSSIRVSLSKYNTKEEIDFFIEKLKDYVTKLRN